MSNQRIQRAPVACTLLTVLLWPLASCGDSSADTTAKVPGTAGTSGATSTLPTITPEHGFPAKVRNFTGTTVLLPEVPVRILPGNAGLLDAAIELTEPAHLAALPSTAFIYSALRDEPGPWKSVYVLPNFEAEPILAAQPDLLLVQPYQLGATVDRVLEHGISVVVMPVASTWQEQLSGIRSMARLFGAEERGSELIKQLELRASALRAPAPRNDQRVLPYGNYGSGGSTAGAGTTWQIMIELAGMRNAATEAGLEGHPGIDFEQLLAIDPDFFLISLPEGDTGSSAEVILTSEPLLQGLRAVRERRFLRLPEFLYSTASHRMLRAAEDIAAQADGF
jgi:ABC-type Fe3+-hydroxamate transport system substrate-binding protein